MTDVTVGGENGRWTPADVQAVTFHETKGFGRGYDEDEVDAFIDRCSEQIQSYVDRVQELEEQNQKLIESEGGNEDIILQSVTILTTAQQTADTTVQNADDYSTRVMTEARSMYEDARLKAKGLVDEAHRMASEAANQVDQHHGDLERQTVYLRVLRDSTQVQVENFLRGLLDHVTAEYGRANPAAAQAAAQAAAEAEAAAAADQGGTDDGQMQRTG